MKMIAVGHKSGARMWSVGLLAFVSAFALSASLCCGGQSGVAKSDGVQGSDPWTAEQLISPKDLAKSLSDEEGQRPVVFAVGPEILFKNGHIPGAKFAGPASKPDGVQSLKIAVDKLPHDKYVVLYCGCCPWDKCPNIRPAFHALHELGFTNVRVLYLPDNLQKDWIAAGYPTEKADDSH